MIEDIYDPLSEYQNVFSKRFKDVAEDTFAELATEAKVDIKTNQETCRLIYSTEEKLASVKSHIGWWTALCVLLWLGIAGGSIAGGFMAKKIDIWVLAVLFAVSFAALLLLFLKVHPKLKELKSEREKLSTQIKELKNKAWEQMAPLNRLYDWDVLTRMMEKTVPRLEFDPYFTTQRLADLKVTYGWDDSFNADRSVLYSHSGLINGNPFIICRTKRMQMGSKTYQGFKTISWTTRERGSDGKYHTVHHSQTLSATVTAPYPEYFEKTRLIYGNTAAPDLVFYRKQSDLAGEEGSFAYRRTRRQLRRKANDLTKSDFAMMTNEEFEVAFDTRNRNNNQQFALLFTPLAQENILRLLKDRQVGYGDDFDFYKNKTINIIIPDHMQELNLDMNPAQYRHFDYEKAKKEFQEINAEYFKAIYFSLAPLLCVPMYQQIRPLEAIYGRGTLKRSSFWEDESLANFWGEDRFKHPSCVTDSILKTEKREVGNGDSVITVYAYGYRRMQRLTYVSVWGGDGRSHQVPVYWDEYISVTGQGSIRIREDNDFEDSAISQRERLDHINTVLDSANLNIYRRHIASKV